MKKYLAIIIVALIACYPFIVYFGLSHFSVRYVAAAITFILLLRLVLLKSASSPFSNGFLMFVVLAGIGISFIGIISNEGIIIKLYPVVMSLCLFCLFSYSLIYPPTIIEKIARLTNKNLTEDAISYTTKVTMVWSVFFITNGMVALWTTLAASTKTWAFYNGFLSYILMGIIFATEFIIRQIVKRRINVESYNE